jgi:DNA-binding HxlR family transcriptional regulator
VDTSYRQVHASRHRLVIRKVFATVPVTVEYAATPPGELLVATRG